MGLANTLLGARDLVARSPLIGTIPLYPPPKGPREEWAEEEARQHLLRDPGTAKRRWVIYNGDVEASPCRPRLAQDGFQPYLGRSRPRKAPMKHKAWEKPHQGKTSRAPHRVVNLRPPGSIRAGRLPEGSGATTRPGRRE